MGYLVPIISTDGAVRRFLKLVAFTLYLLVQKNVTQTNLLCLAIVGACPLTLSKTKDTYTEDFVAAKLGVGLQVLPSPGAWVIDATAKFTPPNGASFLISTLPTPQRFCDRRVGHTILDRSKTQELLMRKRYRFVFPLCISDMLPLGGRAVERRTVNLGDGGSIPPTAVSKLRQFLHPTFACVFRKRH